MRNLSNSQPLEDRVMRKVYGVWFITRLYRNAAKLAVLGVLYFVSSFEVSYANVLKNLQGVQLSAKAFTNYATSAFASTEGIVKLMAIGAAILLAAVVIDLGRMVGKAFTITFLKKAEKRVTV